jgi:hypothetical protein
MHPQNSPPTVLPSQPQTCLSTPSGRFLKGLSPRSSRRISCIPTMSAVTQFIVELVMGTFEVRLAQIPAIFTIFCAIYLLRPSQPVPPTYCPSWCAMTYNSDSCASLQHCALHGSPASDFWLPAPLSPEGPAADAT